MDLHLKNLRPDYLPEIRWSESEIWDKNITWNSGEIIVIRGESGRGKSTLLRILYGLEHRYQGRLIWGGSAIEPFRIKPWPILRRKHLSVILQDFYLLKELNGWQQLQLIPGAQKAWQKSIIEEYCQELSIADCMERPLATWSKGQQQRMAIVRALASPADWILADEPFSHLDQNNTQKAVSLILQHCAQKKCGWILTHLDEWSDSIPNHCYKI